MTTHILHPATPFERIAETLEADGWRLSDRAREPLLAGEPEHARFERAETEPGSAAALQYTFNPVCTLRVAEVAGTRGLPADLRTAGPVDVAIWLDSEDDRDVLRGLLAAALLREPDLADRVAARTSHPRPAIARAAARALDALRTSPGAGGSAGEEGAEARAREASLAAISVLQDQLRPLLRALADDPAGLLAAELRPRPDDHRAAFVPVAADAARAAYDEVWSRGPRVSPVRGETSVRIRLAPAGMLRSDNELSFHFPGGYRGVAHLLQPGRVWARWTYLRPGADAGVSYDGLVWLDDHWAWYPKPYRHLRDLAERTAAGQDEP